MLARPPLGGVYVARDVPTLVRSECQSAVYPPVIHLPVIKETSKSQEGCVASHRAGPLEQCDRENPTGLDSHLALHPLRPATNQPTQRNARKIVIHLGGFKHPFMTI